MLLDKIKHDISDVASAVLDAFKFHDRSPDGMVTDADMSALYEKPPSFTDYLPYLDYDEENEIFELEDGRSVAAVHDFIPIDSEGVSVKFLAKGRDEIQGFLNDVFKKHKECPWVVEFYNFDELSLLNETEALEEEFESTEPLSHLRPFRDCMKELYKKHYKDVCKEGGLFKDETVTDEPWRGSRRYYRMIYYRRYDKRTKPPNGRTAKEELMEIRKAVESRLKQINVKTRRVGGSDFCISMIRWFNPSPKNRTVDELVQSVGNHLVGSERPYGFDLSESMVYNKPRCDKARGIWYFNDKPHTIVSTMGLLRAPLVGSISAPQQNGKKARALFDSMPEGAYLSIKVVIADSEETERDIDNLGNRALGGEADGDYIQEECQKAVRKIKEDRDPMYPVELVCFVRGEDENDLRDKQIQANNVLENAGFRTIDNEDDPIAWRSYLYNLPMAYNPQRNQSRRRSRFLFSQHIANLVPLLGRSRGTGHFGISGFNRGGEPAHVNPLNKGDRQTNGHMTIFGPTGSGKSASLVSIALNYIAAHNARVFIIESGNSFGEAAKYAHSKGVKVKKISMKAKDKTTVAPFANGLKALEAHEEAEEKAKAANEEFEKQLREEQENHNELDDLLDEHIANEEIVDIEEMFADDDEDEQKDYLGEMALTVHIMISGGDAERAKQISVGDKSLIQQALLNAARKVRDEKRLSMLTEDVRDALIDMANSDKCAHNEALSLRFMDYANSLDYFCKGLAGQKFNRAGSLWADSDLTVVDMAEFAKDSKESELAVAYLSILNSIHDLAEQNAEREDSRPIIVISDENHLFIKNGLIAKTVIKIVKMWRKLGAWYWPATQNMEDYAGDARVVLSLCEFWLLLGLEPQQADEVAAFKKLTDEEKNLLMSAQKQDKSYTEAIIISKKVHFLMRLVPPSLILTLAGTDEDERKKRDRVRKEHNCSSPRANEIMAEQLDRDRGIAA